MRHTHFADIRAAAAALAEATGATLGFLPEGGNAVGSRARRRLAAPPAGRTADPQARHWTSASMLESPLAACVLLGGIEPAQDIGHAGAEQALAACRRVIAITPYRGCVRDGIARRSCCRWARSRRPPARYVNVEGRWQEFHAAARSRSARRGPAGRSCACSATCSGSTDSTTTVPTDVLRGTARLRIGGCATTDGSGRARELRAERGADAPRACRSTASMRSCAARRRCSGRVPRRRRRRRAEPCTSFVDAWWAGSCRNCSRRSSSRCRSSAC